MHRLAALLLSLALAFPASARPLTQGEAETLSVSVDAYLAAIGAGSASDIVAAMPPRLLNVFAGATGVEAAALTKVLTDQTAALMEGTRFSDLAAGKSKLKAEEGTLSDGTTVTWVLIPTRFTATTGDAATINEQPLLAVMEDGKWYFLRVDGPERQQVAAAAYPFLAKVKMPEATIRPAN
ncbi:hypothetical protein [Albidovulum sp.]|uniref:hypothetical protein n=1 Tax=Albidovulum sp. TaxID=1872424 RepID=UPI001D87AD69|nr:hypothetical protein [Paracoccaceae bacterium]MCC0045772.1 hypothetical protein [Defluviimonas sp.]HPE26617.1 hypothetical protein [Albidovulum sp.]MCB2122789.1 hypothetical protein [Paracoccaceae bacterium]MCB2134145.1 hypothetical protein [Paracoccaceae bacterium]